MKWHSIIISSIVIPAKAGIQETLFTLIFQGFLDSRFHGNDKMIVPFHSVMSISAIS